jgi:hypothetical protein
VYAGTLTQTEADAVAAWRRKDRKAYTHSLRGHHAKHAGKHLRAAGEDLAAALAHSGGQDTDDARHARAEVARVRARR